MPRPQFPRPHALVLSCALLLAFALPAGALDHATWMRYPAISPDGRTIAFAWRGNLWSVPSAGGVATALTVGSACSNTMPVWSPDGSRIAFASDRNGNFDVYVMPATGGEATRLTFHSADEVPTSFTPDGRHVLFSAAILDAPACVLYPAPAQPELYEVGLDGGMPRQVLTTPALYAAWDPSGKRLAYSDQPGYEMEWRQHDHSSFARQVWVWDAAANRHTRLTAAGADNRQPVWTSAGDSLFYLSETSGSLNVWRMALADPAHPVQVTTHTGAPVRFLSVSRSGDVCYGWDGGIYLRPAGARASHRVEVLASADRRMRAVEPVNVTDQTTEFDVSPDGHEVAFIARGEVFVASTEHGDTKRITSTSEQERGVQFSPDGRSLVYASERGGRWRLYRTSLVDSAEPNFFNATALRETLLLTTDAEAFQPRFSPDGQEVAYLENRTTLRVLDLRTGKVRTILPGDVNYSYEDGDQAYAWSPDSRSFAVQYLSHGRWSNEVGLVPASGAGTLVDVSNSGYEDNLPRFTRKGEMLYWQSDRNGLRQHAGDGQQTDIYVAFLTHAAWDRYKLDEAAYDQLLEREKKDEGGKEGKDVAGGHGKGEGAHAAAAAPHAAAPVAADLDHIEDRIVRFSLASGDLGGAEVTPDGEALVYSLRVDQGYDLWRYVPRKHEAKLVAKLGAHEIAFQLDREGKKAFVLADGRISSVDLESGKGSPVGASAWMNLDRSAERAYLFEHIARQTFEKFLDPAMHGVDWKAAVEHHARFLADIDNDRDFAEMVSEMQGELDASHTGCRYRPTRSDGVETAALGFFPDDSWTGAGVRIAEVLQGGPLQKAGTKVRAGVVIEAIDGTPIAAGMNWYPLLDRKASHPLRLALSSGGTRWEESVTPITWVEQSRLLYERWWHASRATVERLSGGRLGYAHIRGMSDGPYREVFDEIFSRDVDRDAIVLDTRFNGGGNLVEALTELLSGRTYATNAPRGQVVGHEPSRRWSKPSIVVMNQGNYSDAHCFPMAYSQLGLGETVGMPVPGTCSSVWWERLQNRDLVFGIPEVALIDMQGDVMENKQLEPDHRVEPDPADVATGRDAQLEKAVEVLMAKLPRR